MRLINDDCLRAMRGMPDGCVDLVVTSPPYNCGIKYDSWNDRMPHEEYVSWCGEWICELYRLCRDDGRIAVNVLYEQGIDGNRTRISPMRIFSDLIEKAGFSIMAVPLWVDTHRVKYTSWGSWKSASAPYIYCPYEAVIIAYKKHRKKLRTGEDTISKEDFMMGCSGIWDIGTDTSSATMASFPLRLPKLAIELLSFKEDEVLDPFMGSGTTGVASKITGRDFIGIEISRNYFNEARYRIENTGLNDDLFEVM